MLAGHGLDYGRLRGRLCRRCRGRAKLAEPALQGRMEATFGTAHAAIAKTSAARIDLHTAERRDLADVLCDYASEHGFDVLVIGRHGHGGLVSRKIGHIAEAVVRSCSIPVLLVSVR